MTDSQSLLDYAKAPPLQVLGPQPIGSQSSLINMQGHCGFSSSANTPIGLYNDGNTALQFTVYCDTASTQYCGTASQPSSTSIFYVNPQPTGRDTARIVGDTSDLLIPPTNLLGPTVTQSVDYMPSGMAMDASQFAPTIDGQCSKVSPSVP